MPANHKEEPPSDKLTELVQLLEGARNNLARTTPGTDDHAAAQAEVERWAAEEAELRGAAATGIRMRELRDRCGALKLVTRDGRRPRHPPARATRRHRM